MTTKTEAVPASPAGERAEGFKDEVRSLKIKDPDASKEGLYAKVGLVLMVAGIVVSVIAYFMSHGTNSVLTQNDSLTIGMLGIALAIVGGAVFLRYSIAGFLRFWLARFIVEQQRDGRS
jgi:hypothetical protein